MALTTGTRLGPYEILSALGAGGMGEVYKARDTRLDRIVAIKILPEALAADPQFRERFEREARAISQLTHANVCTLYDVGRHDLTDFLVMEYLEGETLADRLTKGALPLDQALRIAIQMASALDTAHRAGIVHRDLKPGNIMLTKAGVGARQGSPQAKLLDFGLAKAGGPAVTGAGLSMLPTAPPGLTAQGTILGTFQYMAPEQLEGKDADARTDIFAFGAMLYEMLTGKKAFQGTSHASLIAAIMSSDPKPVSALQPLTPPALDRLVGTCLAKDPDDRWQSVRDVMFTLQSVGDTANSTTGETARRQRLRTAWLGWAVAAVLAVGLIGALTFPPRTPVTPRPLSRLSIPPPEQTTFIGGYGAPHLALSPDGRRLAFVPTPIGGPTLLWIRDLGSLTVLSLTGTDGATYPFWSPDGRSIGFFADGKLKTISSAGGVPQAIADAPDARGGAWGEGVIVFAPQLDGPLYRVPAIGGPRTAITSLDVSRQEVSHRLPSFLPDGHHFLFLAQSGRSETSVVFVASIDSTAIHPLSIQGSKAIYAAGFVVFGRERSLMAQPFNLSQRQLSGEPFALGDQVTSRSAIYGDGLFSVASDGTLAYWNGGPSVTRLTWFGRKGEALGNTAKPGDYLSLALSADEKKIAVELVDPASQVGDIWAIDAATGISSRLTTDPSWDFGPLWSRDSSTVVFGSIRSGRFSLYQTALTANGVDQLLLSSPDALGPSDWSSTSGLVVLQNLTQFKVGVVATAGAPSPNLGFKSAFAEADGRLSPDGRWLAYTSNESGTWDVYVRSFPALDQKWRISPDGGSRPAWRPDGKELFFMAPDQTLMATPITGDAQWSAGVPRPLFQMRTVPVPPTQPRRQYAVGSQGDRFLVNTVVEPAVPTPVTIMLNWPAALRK